VSKVTASQEVVTPAKAGVQMFAEKEKNRIPASAGMTKGRVLQLF